MKKNKTLRFIIIYILSGVAFFILTFPFHKILSVFTVTEVRPSAVLYPFLGISFGWPAALGIMTANFLCDALNGYSIVILIEGIIPQIIYTIVPFYLWNFLMKGEDHKHRLDSVARVLKYIVICLVFSVLSACGVGLMIFINFHTNPVLQCLFVLLNNFDMAIILGMPLMVLSNQYISRRAGTERTLTKNETIIVITALIQALLTIGVATLVYGTDKTVGTYNIWNTIFIITLISINVTMLISLVCMIYFEQKEKKLEKINEDNKE